MFLSWLRLHDVRCPASVAYDEPPPMTSPSRPRSVLSPEMGKIKTNTSWMRIIDDRWYMIDDTDYILIDAMIRICLWRSFWTQQKLVMSPYPVCFWRILPNSCHTVCCIICHMLSWIVWNNVKHVLSPPIIKHGNGKWTIYPWFSS